MKKELDNLIFENKKKQKILDLLVDPIEESVEFNKFASIEVRIQEFNYITEEVDIETETLTHLHMRVKKERIF